MTQNRLVLAGTNSNVGKTTITMGLLKALVNRGEEVQGFKAGPDYIDPAFHTHVTKRKSRNLDPWMLSQESIKELYLKNIGGANISIIEGVMGLYDGLDITSVGSTAHLSKVLKSPVVLIIDGSGIASSAAAQVLGYKMYDTDVDIQGVIINKVHGEKHYNILKEAIEVKTKVKCYGYLNKNSNLQLESRHLGLIPSVELKTLDQTIDLIASMIEQTVDIEGLIDLSKKAPVIEHEIQNVERAVKNVKIGVAYDKAFNFYYEDNFDLLKQMGADLVYFSPLEDKVLPSNIHGLYIGGGFPEVFAQALMENKSMRQSIKQAINNGLPTYTECGGLMYMCECIRTLDGQKYSMVGALKADSIMTKRLQNFGYVNVTTRHSLLGDHLTFKAHEFHRSKVIPTGAYDFSYDVIKKRNGKVIKEYNDGYLHNNLLAAYQHIHFYANKSIAVNFLKACQVYSFGGK